MSLPPAQSLRITRSCGYKLFIDGNRNQFHHNGNHKSLPHTAEVLSQAKDSRNQSRDANTKHRKGSSGRKSKDAPSRANPDPHHRALVDSDFDARIILRALREADGQICDFVVVEANSTACEYNQLAREQFIGQRLLALFPNTRSTGLFDLYVRTMETGEPLELDNFPYPHDLLGQKRRLAIRAVRVGDDLAYTWRDLTGSLPLRSDGDGSRPIVLERRKSRPLSAQAEAQIREFQGLAHHLLELREQEQQSISRELHDNIAQVLSAVTTRISLAESEPIPAWLRQELLDLRDHIKGALADVRNLARELRPSVLDHLGFAAALEKHADAFRERARMTLAVTIVPEAVGFLDGNDLTHLFRLTQEALQNIEEHSGAKNAWIDLWENDGAMQLEIGDDGCAFTPERVAEAQRDGHLGLLGMRERAELLGARFLLEAVPDQGTVIRLTIPPPRKTPGANEPDQTS